mmetsp:Transcript_23180/g.60628  ORF Transcript_23180/g.60628 Transcript_23180/m.60628 type:complete len:80 (+) Transcript_23180:554-793(+)
MLRPSSAGTAMALHANATTTRGLAGPTRQSGRRIKTTAVTGNAPASTLAVARLTRATQAVPFPSTTFGDGEEVAAAGRR